MSVVSQFSENSLSVELNYSSVNISTFSGYPPYSYEEIDWMGWGHWIGTRREYAGYAGISYLLAILVLKVGMSRKFAGFEMNGFLLLWNLGLGLLSTWALIRITPPLLVVLWDDGFTSSVCT